MISESACRQVKDDFDAKPVDAVVVKRKTEPVNGYRSPGRRGEAASEQLQSWQKR